MFDELKRYKTHGNFQLLKGAKLSVASKAVPEQAGVYYIIRLARGRVDLVYIGKTSTINQDGDLGIETLRWRITNRQDGTKWQLFFDKKFNEENIDGLDIYWFVTMDDKVRHLPGYVEGLLMQNFYELYERLPEWNEWY
jgi:hypothetical protein